jgi:sensor c-di-GMP phosphodiesterase-like protein
VSFITPDLIFDVFSDESAVSMGIVTGSEPFPITIHGTVKPEWAARLGAANRMTFVEGGTVVALERCRIADVVAIAAQPASQASWRLFRTSLLFMSLGGLIGVALMAAAVRSIRGANTFPSLLRRAIAERQFFLVLQPIIDLSSSQIVGAEALIRWRKPSGEVMSPAIFVPMAEEANLMPEITNQVIDMALPAAKALIETDEKFYLAINLTSEDIRSGRIPPRLRDLSAQHSVPLRNLGVEVTESGLLSGPEDMRCLDEFRDMGVRISMDDFGTGYSSLAYLMNIHIDVLKIDKIFVDAIGTEAATSSVIGHMIRMAKELHLPIVAEGVETAEQAAFLRENGVQYAQGYYFGKPVELEQFLATVTERSRTATPV